MDVLSAKVSWVDRQFATVGTRAQDKFDIVFGVVAPVICFRFDPIAFKGVILNGGLFEDYQVQVYFVSAVQIALFAVWLIFGRHLKGLSVVIGGALLGGGFVSFALGFMLLPFSVVGMMVVIGWAGLIPFITGFVYLRCGVRAFLDQRHLMLFRSRFAHALFAGIAAVAIPWIVGMQVSRLASQSVARIISRDATETDQQGARMRLKLLPLLPEKDRRTFVSAYVGEKDPLRIERLKANYRLITGEDIESQRYLLMD